MKAAELLRSRAFGELKQYILEHTGLSYYAPRDEDLAARISRRLEARGVTDAAAYLQLLGRDPGEVDCLVGELTIGETYFFRQAEHFELLRTTLIPEILNRKGLSRRLRIWSAGCATGAEPYSIAILLLTQFERELAGWNVSILATDINVDFLARAQEGLFGSWALRETPPEIQARCFRHEGRMWRLLPEFRRPVTFQYHNLMSDTHPSADALPFDLILCRNVLIYFSQETIRAVARKLFHYLDTGGKLLVGYAEPNQENFTMFQTVSTSNVTIYGKGDGHAIPNTDWQVQRTSPLLPEWPSFNFAPLPDVYSIRSPRVPAPEADVVQKPIKMGVEDVRRLADRGNWKLARDAANQLVQTEPLNASAHFTLGLIMEEVGEHEAARESLRRAIYLDRGFALAHYHLGTLLQSSGDREAAIRSLQTTLRLVNRITPGEPLPHGDGITASELAGLATAHLELITK